MELKSFESFVNERYLNAFKDSEKEKYKDVIYHLLQKSYATMGGLKGNGFRSPDDMVKNIPFWKIVKRGENIVAVAMYKDKNGRKRVAVGSDGTDAGKAAVADIFKSEFDRAYFEISEKSLKFHDKTLGTDFLLKYAVNPSKVRGITGDDVEYPVPDDDEEVKRHPRLKAFFYRRDIGGHMHTKILLGTPGKKIVISEEME